MANVMTYTSGIFSGFDLSNMRDRGQLLQTYEMWFERYPQHAKASLRQRLGNGDNALGAWFELVLHELLFQLGCKLDVVDIDNTDKTPDFLTSHQDRSCYVEATIVNPRDNIAFIDDNFENAKDRLNTLHSPYFQIRLTVDGKLTRTLSNKELMEPFRKLLGEHDPAEVREQIALMGEYGAPYTEIKDNGWVLRGVLRPIPPEGKHRTSPGLIVEVGGIYTGDASPEVQKAVSRKAGKYGRLPAPLIVAANVLDIRFDREAEVAALFGQAQIRYFPDRPDIPDQLIRKPDGVWVKGGYKPRYTRLAGVMMFNGFLPWSPRGTACLYVNPFANDTDLPQPLYSLPHAIDEDGRINWVEGIHIETILATK